MNFLLGICEMIQYPYNWLLILKDVFMFVFCVYGSCVCMYSCTPEEGTGSQETTVMSLPVDAGNVPNYRVSPLAQSSQPVAHSPCGGYISDILHIRSLQFAVIYSNKITVMK